MGNESYQGKTPAGGVSSEIFYMNEQGEIVDKKSATQAVIRELDEKGNIINETWGMIGEG